MHFFDEEIACEVGMDAAVIYQNIYFWVEKNKANDKHFYDGTYWTYNSVKAFCELFPYMSNNQIRRALKTLEEKGYIITGNYNKVAYDRTKWYALTEKGFAKLDKTICSKQQMEVDEKTNRFVPDDKPIPDINTDVNTDVNTDIYKQDKPAKSQKHKHGEYKHVILTSDEYQKLCEEWGEQEVLRMIKILDEGIETKGYKYKNHNLALRKWRANEKQARPKTIWNDGTTDADTSEYEAFF
jgi:DNA-binding PadR family transcriptional regulator